MTRDASRNRGAIIRRLHAALDERAGDFSVTPAFTARVQRLRRRRRIVRQTTRAFALAAIVVVLAVTAVNALRPSNRIDFVSPPATETPSPSPATESHSATPSPPASEPSSATPSASLSEGTGERPSPPPSQSQSEPASESHAAPDGPQLTADTPIDLYGIGPIEAGMTLGAAERAAGVDLIPENFETFGGRCYHAHAEGLEEDFSLLVRSPGEEGVDRPEDGIVMRVSATQSMESPAQTLSGVAVGDTEDEVHRTYAGQIESAPHVYIEGGHYLSYIPQHPADEDYRVVFFTDGSVVQEIHAGDAQAAGSVEGGCV